MDRIKVRGTVQTGVAGELLADLAEALRAGGLRVQSGGDTLEFAVGQAVRFDLRGRARPDGRRTVRLRLTWRAEPPAETGIDLAITPGSQK
jgi:amphi-Trp domain-containing protein